jgi:tRNA-5-methyluridine54 2-sulfurtransferase
MRVRLRHPDRTEVVAGPATVTRVLEQLDINPETVLVIHEATLVTKDHVIPDDAEIEIRPVISGGSGPAKCHACRQPAIIEIPRHHAAYCATDFVDHIRTQVRAAISKHRMLSYDDRILVAVSGGKDSLALWDVLLDMGYRADGLYLGLGIGGYSDRSGQAVRDFAERRGATLHQRELEEGYGFDIPLATTDRTRSACGVCGLSKRYVFNQVAREGGYDVMATGHNLDDEAATLLGNVLRWQTPFLSRQSVALPTTDTMARKVKPLYRLSEREMAAYCVIQGIEYVVEECPMVGGNTVLRYKDALNELERTSPGTKASFLFGFLDGVQADHFPEEGADGVEVVPCSRCDAPTTPSRGRAAGEAPVCAFCRTRGRLLRMVERAEPTPA